MKKEHQNILYTVLGIGLLVALFMYLKRAMTPTGGGGLGLGSTGSNFLPSLGAKIEKGAEDIAHKISDGYHKITGSIGLVNPDKVNDYVSKLVAIETASAQSVGKITQPNPAISIPLKQITDLNDDMFKAVIRGFKKRLNYASIKQSNIWKTSDRNIETADFINRALKYN